MNRLIVLVFTVAAAASVPNFALAQADDELKKLDDQIRQLEALEDRVDIELEQTGPQKMRILVNVTYTEKDKSASKSVLNGSTVVSSREALPEIDLSGLEGVANLAGPKSIVVKCGNIDAVRLVQIGVSQNYCVTRDYVYSDGGVKITVPMGFVYDRASIPPILRGIIDKDSLGNVAPLIHDYLYRKGGVLPNAHVDPFRTFNRDESDSLFLRAMTDCGVGKVRRKLAHWAVKTFGAASWNTKPGQALRTCSLR